MDALYSATVLGPPLYLILWVFIIYSVLGVVVELVFCLVVEGVVESRQGLLYLPLRPIYGLGGASCTVLLHHLITEPVVVFVLGMLICTAIEYAASLVMEKLSGAISWDYGDKPLNVHGRVCLQYSASWGLLSLLVVYVLDPVVYSVVKALDGQIGQAILTVLLIMVALSAVLTAGALNRIARRVGALRAPPWGEPATTSLTSWQRLIDRLAPDVVVINTFPRMSLISELSDRTGQQRAWIRWSGHPAWRHQRDVARTRSSLSS